MGRNDGITGITLSTNIPGHEPVTVSPDAFDRYVDSLKHGGSPMPTAIAAPITVRVPDDEDFDGADFMAEAGLEAILSELVSAYPALDVIERHGISVSVLWKRKGGKSQGVEKMAKCQKPSGLLSHFCTADFVIWLGADNLKARGWTTEQVRKILYHEARHIGWQEPAEDDEEGEGKPIILGHDLELFVGEVRDMGAWEHFRQQLARDFQQPGLGL